MKKSTVSLAIAVIMVLFTVATNAQERKKDNVTVELTDPSAPVFLSVSLISGGVKVSGYDGDEVLIQSIAMMQRITRPTPLISTRPRRFPI